MVRLLFLFSFLSIVCYGQRSEINSCQGAVDISNVSEINVAFQGFKGSEKGKQSLFFDKEISKNSVWFVYEASVAGNLKLNCRIYIDSFDIMVLRTSMNSPCEDLEENKAVPVLIKPNTTCNEVNNAIINVETGFSYSIVFFTKEKDESNIYLSVDFERDKSLQVEKKEPLVLNLVYNNQKPIYSIHLLDDESKEPVPSRITISNSGDLDGTYLASDLYLNVNRRIKQGLIKIDAEGYLSKDLEEYVIQADPTKIIYDTLFLKKLKKGTVAKIDKIYFKAGTSIILEESLPKIRRLRDFLILNARTKIEIQGHVNLDGNNRSAKRLSKKRAKEIMKYLISQGVQQNRLSAVGFGAKKLVYKNPQSEEEKEANRRVEILIK